MRVTALALAASLAACASATSPQGTDTPDIPPRSGKIAAPGRVQPFHVGALEAFALHDGDIDVANDGKTLGLGRPTSEVAEVLSAAGLDGDRATLSIQPLVVKAGGRVLLFDTGAADASWARAGHLAQALTNAGLEPGAVTDVFVSHAHPDHAGGLVTKAGTLAFPNATVHLSAPEWAALQKSEEMRSMIAVLTPKVDAFEPGAQLLPEVRAVDTRGHTPGHSSYLITSGGESLFYLGDVAHHFVVSTQRPAWTIAFDHDSAAAAEAMRQQTLATLARDGTRVYAVHFPFPGLGHLRAQGEGFRWEMEEEIR